MGFCANCGNNVSDDSAFCAVCGTPVRGVQDTAPMEAPEVYAQEAVKTQGANGAVIAAISGAVLVVVAALIALLMFLGAIPNPFAGESVDGDPAEAGDASLAVTGSSDEAGEVGEGDSDASTFDSRQLDAFDVVLSQVDNASFPQVRLYASFTDSKGARVEDVKPEYVTIKEFGSDGAEHVGQVTEIAPMAIGDAFNINLVLDQSGSMNDQNKMTSAKTAAQAFIDEISQNPQAVTEITSFDNNVFNRQPFTSEASLLKNAVTQLRPGGQTALYDSLYWALQRTNLKQGSRVVIAFTDGEENASHYSKDDVVGLSDATGIPVYVIGIGQSVNKSDLQSIASKCNGRYFDASEADLAKVLQDIYQEIYNEQMGMYKITFNSTYPDATDQSRTLQVCNSDAAPFECKAERSYIPVDNVSSYANDGNSADYVLPDSASRVYSNAELEALSTWELYLARNEMFAKHGRRFKNQDLMDYFSTKSWYNGTYSPEEFDDLGISLTSAEQANAAAMLEIEKARNSPYLVTAK